MAEVRGRSPLRGSELEVLKHLHGLSRFMFVWWKSGNDDHCLGSVEKHARLGPILSVSRLLLSLPSSNSQCAFSLPRMVLERAYPCTIRQWMRNRCKRVSTKKLSSHNLPRHQVLEARGSLPAGKPVAGTLYICISTYVPIHPSINGY